MNAWPLGPSNWSPVVLGIFHILGFPSSWGYPNSWMVFVRENPIKLDDDWGYPYFWKPSFGSSQLPGERLSPGHHDDQTPHARSLGSRGRRRGATNVGLWPLRSIPKEFMLSPLGHPDKSWPQLWCQGLTFRWTPGWPMGTKPRIDTRIFLDLGFQKIDD